MHIQQIKRHNSIRGIDRFILSGITVQKNTITVGQILLMGRILVSFLLIGLVGYALDRIMKSLHNHRTDLAKVTVDFRNDHR